MKYADANCEKTERFFPYHTFTFTGACMITGETYSVTVKGEDLFKYRQGALLQDAFPTLDPSDREFLLTGVSPKGWKKLYS